MTTHELKTWPEYFTASLFGNKSFELRIKDRDFKIGDFLVLQEWDPKTHAYSGRALMRQVVYILEGAFGLPEDMIIMGVVVV